MTKGPIRLIHEDPGFARLVAASKNYVPSEQIDKALVLVTETARSSRPTWRRCLVPGLAVSAAIVALGATSAVVRMNAAIPVSKSAPRAVVATPAPGVPATALAETPVTVSVEDLASTTVPVSSATSLKSRREAAAKARPEPRVRGVRGHDVAPLSPKDDVTKNDVTVPTEQSRPAPAAFSEELALVAAARAAIEAGDGPSSMRAVQQHKERFPSGMFAEEIEAIRVEALAASGKRAEAHAAAERFLATNAKSPYAARVRSLLDSTLP